MPELPEIASRAAEMDQALTGKTIDTIEILQPKCLNLPPAEFQFAFHGAKIESTRYHGKWIMVQTSKGWLLLNMGMGGELLLLDRDHLPKKYRLVFDFLDKTCLTVNFWWFGYSYYSPIDGLDKIPMIAKLGPNILDLSQLEFSNLVEKQKGRVKAFLLDQSKAAGIGNAYIHDILFLARLHPNASISNLTAAEKNKLYTAIQDGLRPSLAKGGAFYETSLFGEKGHFTMDDILIGYKDGKPCPKCSTLIQKIKTGNTQSFICPTCQPERN